MCGVEKYRFIVIDVVIACHSASLLIVMSAKSYKDLDWNCFRLTFACRFSNYLAQRAYTEVWLNPCSRTGGWLVKLSCIDSSGSPRADMPSLSTAIPPSNLNALDFVSTSLSLSSLHPELCALKSRSPTPTKIKMPAVFPNLAESERLEIMAKEGYRCDILYLKLAMGH